jgi:hypothetical protein
MVVHACHPSYVGRVNRRVAIQPSLGIKFETLFKKIPKAKKD